MKNSDVFAYLCGHAHYAETRTVLGIQQITAESFAFGVETVSSTEVIYTETRGYNTCWVDGRDVIMHPHQVVSRSTPRSAAFPFEADQLKKPCRTDRLTITGGRNIMSLQKRLLTAGRASALLCHSLTGCGSTTSGGQSGDAGDGEKIKIQYWHINSENQGGAAVQEFIDTFNASQDDIEVEGRFNSSYDELLKNLQADTAAGNAPSIVQVSWSNIEYFPANFPTSAPRRSFREYFPEDARSSSPTPLTKASWIWPGTAKAPWPACPTPSPTLCCSTTQICCGRPVFRGRPPELG